MKLKDFVDSHHLRKCSPDKMLAQALVKMAAVDESFLAGILITVQSARKVVTGYYDILRSLLEAVAVLEGYKMYSHEVFVVYLQEKGEFAMSEKFDRFRRVRNGIMYYGEDVQVEEAKEYVKIMQE